MKNEYLVLSVGPNKKTGEVQSACSPVVRLADGRQWVKTADRIWLDGLFDVGQLIELETSVVVPAKK